MRFYFTHEYGKRPLWLRTFDIIPALSINFYQEWAFESVRLSWLGFMMGIYFKESEK